MKDDWTNHLSIAFKATNEICYRAALIALWLATVRGSVFRGTLAKASLEYSETC